MDVRDHLCFSGATFNQFFVEFEVNQADVAHRWLGLGGEGVVEVQDGDAVLVAKLVRGLSGRRYFFIQFSYLTWLS